MVASQKDILGIEKQVEQLAKLIDSLVLLTGLLDERVEALEQKHEAQEKADA